MESDLNLGKSNKFKIELNWHFGKGISLKKY